MNSFNKVPVVCPEHLIDFGDFDNPRAVIIKAGTEITVTKKWSKLKKRFYLCWESKEKTFFTGQGWMTKPKDKSFAGTTPTFELFQM